MQPCSRFFEHIESEEINKENVMTIDHRQVDQVMVIALGGKMMGGTDATQFYEALREWIKQGYRRFVIDLGEADWMNSSGLGMLICGLKTIREFQGNLWLASIPTKIQSVLEITKLVTVFQHSGTVEEAVGNLNN
jgi:anti-sigma B factor antagonist